MSLLAASAQAEEERGLSIMERGAQLFFEGLMKEMEPAIEEFSGFADQIGPAMRDFVVEMGPKLSTLLEEVQDWSVYEAPEILPNGDIIIRRKPDPDGDAPSEAPAPQVEL
ncbi:MAG: hypothetical protein AAF943_03930 [Pseudomonadota bacterium]